MGGNGALIYLSTSGIINSGSGYIYTPSSVGSNILNSLLKGRTWIVDNGIPLVYCTNIDTLPSLYISIVDSYWFEIPATTYVKTAVHFSY